MLNFIRNLSWSELLLIAIVIVAFFGTKRIIDLSRRLGTSSKQIIKIKKELESIKGEVTQSV